MNSIMFSVKVDRGEPTELHVQVAAEIRRAIADGEARPGERLPPARDLAAVLGVNANTVLRALRVLRDEGLLEFRRGRGVTVAGTPGRDRASSKPVPGGSPTLGRFDSGAAPSKVGGIHLLRSGYGLDPLLRHLRGS